MVSIKKLKALKKREEAKAKLYNAKLRKARKLEAEKTALVKEIRALKESRKKDRSMLKKGAQKALQAIKGDVSRVGKAGWNYLRDIRDSM